VTNSHKKKNSSIHKHIPTQEREREIREKHNPNALSAKMMSFSALSSFSRCSSDVTVVSSLLSSLRLDLGKSPPRIGGESIMMSTRRRQQRRQRQRRSASRLVAMAAKSSNYENDEISDDDKGGAVWTQTTAFELYAREINNKTSKLCFARLTSAESGAVVDPSVFLLCVFAASSSTSSSFSSSENENSETSFRSSSPVVAFTHKQMREMTRISERWNWKILKRVESAEMSLFSLADPPENVPPAREFGLELKRLRERMERAKRAQMWKLVEDERWWGDSGGGSGEEEEEENRSNSSSSSSSNSSSNIGGGDGEKETDDDAEKMFFDASTRTACENIRVYFEYLGFQPTSREWISIQTLLAECLTSEKDRSMIRVKDDDDDVNDDDDNSSSSSPSFRLLKRIIDRKTQKPWKDAERRKLNHRYLLARENLLRAKEEWKDAEKSYKEARRKMSKARHEVAKTRKHVRIEFR